LVGADADEDDLNAEAETAPTRTGKSAVIAGKLSSLASVVNITRSASEEYTQGFGLCRVE